MPVESFESFQPRIAPGAFVHAGAYLLGDVVVGEQSSIWPAAVLRGDHGAIRIGARSSVQDGCVAHATENHSETLIGDECTVGHRVVLHGCRVGNRCLVGMGSVLLDNAELGEWSFVGAGTLLTPGKKFPPKSFILGAPGRRVRDTSAKEIEWIVFSWKSYQDLAQRYLRQSQK